MGANWRLGAHGVLVGACCVGLAGFAGGAPRAVAQQPSVAKRTISDERENQRLARVSTRWVVFEDDRRQPAGTSPRDIQS